MHRTSTLDPSPRCWYDGGDPVTEHPQGGPLNPTPASIECPGCHQPVEPSARFCPGCGTALDARCPSCGERVEPGTRFCSACGVALASPSTASSSPAFDPSVRPAFSREDETRLVTTLFADLSGSVAATEGLDPEAALERVDAVLQIMARIVHEHEGRVDRFLGDGLLAVFGTPRTREDDPLRAIAAGLAIVEAIRAEGMDATAGVNTGEVYVGRIGSDDHREFSAMGPVINLASRLQGAAAPGEVVVGESSYRLTRRAFSFVPRTLAIKGMSRPVSAYVALRPLERPERAHGIEGMRASLTGRDAELARLETTLLEMAEGRARVASVVGEAGVGKSRLVEELRRRAERGTESGLAASVQWLEGRCFESTIATAYGPFVDLLLDYFAFAPSDDAATRSDRIDSVLTDLADHGHLPGDRREEVATLLAHLLSAGHDRASEALARASSEEIKHRTFGAVTELLAAIAREQPLVVALGDLHWSDTLSLELVQRLVEDLDDRPVLLLLVYRPERLHRSRRLERFAVERAGDRQVRIELAGLDPEQSVRLLDSLLTVDALPKRLLDTIVERAQGNPLFLEEMLRSLIEAGIVRRTGGRWRAESDAEAVEVPDTVQAIVLSRVDRLDEPVRRTLQLASVVGRVFPRALLTDLVGDEEAIERALWQLEQVDLVRLERLAPEEEYTFRHVLARDAVYGNLLRSRRAALHGQVAAAMEARYAHRLDDVAGELAEHHERAGDAERAIALYARAADVAHRAHANEEAIALLQRGLALLEATPGSSERDRRELELLTPLGSAMALARGWAAPEVEDTHVRARALAEVVGTPKQRGRMLSELQVYLMVRARFEEARAVGEELVKLDRERGEPTFRIVGEFTLGECSWFSGRFETSLAHFGTALDACEAGPLERGDSPIELVVASGCMAFMAQAYWFLGRGDDALERNRRNLALAEDLGHPFSRAFGEAYTAMFHHFRDDPQALETHARAGRALCDRYGYPYYGGMCTILSGWATTRLDDPPRGLEIMKEGFEALLSTGGELRRPYYLALLAEAHGAVDRPEEGLALLEEATDLIDASGEEWCRAPLERRRGRLLQAMGREAEAAAAFDRAVRRARNQRALLFERRAAADLDRLGGRAPGRGR